MLDLLDEYIELRGWNRYRIDGRGGHGANQDEINEFNTAPFSDDSKPQWEAVKRLLLTVSGSPQPPTSSCFRLEPEVSA